MIYMAPYPNLIIHRIARVYFRRGIGHAHGWYRKDRYRPLRLKPAHVAELLIDGLDCVDMCVDFGGMPIVPV